ncbi:MAG: metal ABC transporter ATP-binding protein [Bacilli bacterium]
MKTNTLIDIQHLHFAFDQRPVIQDVSLSFTSHDRLALVGGNGAGKTTLLKIILGLVNSDQGNVVIKKNLTIGYLPQVLSLTDKLFPMTVKEVVAQGLISQKAFPRWLSRGDQKTIETMLNSFQLTSLKNDQFGLLSLGQKQMVLFARMMMQKPDIVFLDEPTSSLDVNRKDSLYQILDDLKKKKVPYVIVTHDLPSFSDHINRVVYLEHQILFDGSYKKFCEMENISPFIHTHGDHHDH